MDGNGLPLQSIVSIHKKDVLCNNNDDTQQSTTNTLGSFELASRCQNSTVSDKNSRSVRGFAGIDTSPFNIHVAIFILCLIGSFSTLANALVCPQPCQCSRPSTYPSTKWTLSTVLPSVNCSGQGLADIQELIYSLDEHENIGNVSASQTLEVHHLDVLDMSNNFLNNVYVAETFGKNMTCRLGITKMDFSHNSISSFTVNETCLLDHVFTIDLSFNNLMSMDDSVWISCSGFRSLRDINLSHNFIKSTEGTMFSNLIQLNSLDLSFNQLQSLSTAVFSGLTSLQYLSLKGNNITKITGVFPILPNLNHLDLSNNVVDDLPNNFFSHLTSLEKLNLNNNRITYLEANVFNGLASLTKLSMNQNPLISIDEPVFQNTALQWLSLCSMPHLKNISYNAFYGLSNLTYLNMSNNQLLTFLQPNILSPMGSLQILDLSYSGFQQLSSITFLNPKLRRVYLQGLPLSCVCTNAWLVGERRKADSIFLNAVINECVVPTNKTIDTDFADFNCGVVHITNTTQKIVVQLGSSLMLQCQQVSEEDNGVLKWTTPSGQTIYHHDFHPQALLHLFTPEDVQPDAPFHKNHYWHHSSTYHSEISSNSDRIMVLTDGSLYIDYMLRQDAGEYKCEVKNPSYNHSITVTLRVQNDLSGWIKIYAFVVGFLCALGFFALNVVYVIISWIARRLVNKRRREIIMQMLESLNSYKSVQVSRIHENYLHQLNRVRNQYHTQVDKLHKNYTGQVAKVKRGCSNQVERVRDNYHSKLANLRDYSSKQIMQIREGANNQIARIRDYGSLQLDRLRETYKLQQQHVLKLLDTMNLDNCRSVVETECMRTESMMFDIDLLEPDVRIDSPTSPESEYSTAASSPNMSEDDFTDDEDNDMELDDMHQRMYSDVENMREGNGRLDDNIQIEMNTSLPLPGGLHLNAREVWNYTGEEDSCNDHILYTKVNGPGMEGYEYAKNKSSKKKRGHGHLSELASLPLYTVTLDQQKALEQSAAAGGEDLPSNGKITDETWSSGNYATPEASPIKSWSKSENKNEFTVDLADIDIQSKSDSKRQESEL